MIGKTYIITSASNNGEIVLKYNLNGFLIGLEITAQLEEQQYRRLFITKELFLQQNAETMCKEPNSKIKIVPEDLSFERFWNEYDCKVGKRVMTENTWKRMNKREKVDALNGIKAYNFYLAKNQGISKAYPSTYLNQRYWENYK